eukprot:1911943-Amphidinium_carterae.1
MAPIQPVQEVIPAVRSNNPESISCKLSLHRMSFPTDRSMQGPQLRITTNATRQFDSSCEPELSEGGEAS